MFVKKVGFVSFPRVCATLHLEFAREIKTPPFRKNELRRSLFNVIGIVFRKTKAYLKYLHQSEKAVNVCRL